VLDIFFRPILSLPDDAMSAAAPALPVTFSRDQALAVGARVPWDSYVPASLSQADVKAIRTLSAATPARVAELLAARDAEALLYPQALVKVRFRVRLRAREAAVERVDCSLARSLAARTLDPPAASHSPPLSLPFSPPRARRR